jgi:hypothetical protein
VVAINPTNIERGIKVMRHPKKKTRFLVAVILLTVCFPPAAAMVMAQGVPEKTEKAEERGSIQREQSYPAAQAPGKGLCTGGACSTGKGTDQTAAQPSNNCPAAGPARTENEKPSK